MSLNAQFWQELVDRRSGPFDFRFILQPAMAVFLAWRQGMHDAIHAVVPWSFHWQEGQLNTSTTVDELPASDFFRDNENSGSDKSTGERVVSSHPPPVAGGG
jgi:hypothetical protein